MQEMQEQINSMNDSGEFQEVESNHSGRGQPGAIPGSRSVLSCDKRLPLDTRNMSGPLENVFGNQFSANDSSRNHYQGIKFIILRHQVLQDRFRCILVRGLLSQEMKIELGAQFQCRHFQEGRRPWVHEFQWIFRRIRWLISKDSKYRNFKSTNSLHFLHFYDWW